MISRSRKCLPADMWTEVLYRLPVESLVRCRSVSKMWHQIIRTSFFVKTHLQYQKTSSNTNKYILQDQLELYRLLTDFESIFNETEHSKLYYTPESFVSDFPRGKRKIRIQGICDGLLCVSNKGYHVGDNIYLWNPICRKAKKLPRLGFLINTDDKHLGNGGLSLGYYNDDYKVIAISPVAHVYIVSIYSLSTNSWKILPNFSFEAQTVSFLPSQPTKFVNGTSYMITNTQELVCFNLGVDDTIRLLKLPEEVVNFEYTLEAYEETVAVLGSGRLESRYLYMWILRDNWEKKFVIELQQVGFTLAVGFLNYNQYLIRTLIFEGDLKRTTKFFLCDLKSPKLIEFRSQDGYPMTGLIDSNCVESLLLLDDNSSLSPFVRIETQSTCSSITFILYNEVKDRHPK